MLGCDVAIAADKEAVECSGRGDDGLPVNRAGGLKRLERMELREGREVWTVLGWGLLFVLTHKARSVPGWSCSCNSAQSFCK